MSTSAVVTSRVQDLEDLESKSTSRPGVLPGCLEVQDPTLRRPLTVPVYEDGKREGWRGHVDRVLVPDLPLERMILASCSSSRAQILDPSSASADLSRSSSLWLLSMKSKPVPRVTCIQPRRSSRRLPGLTLMFISDYTISLHSFRCTQGSVWLETKPLVCSKPVLA